MTGRATATTYARTAREAFEAAATTFLHLRPDEWSGPTGCAKWDMGVLAGHIVGEAVWFLNVVRRITEGEASHPASLYEELKRLPAAELAARTAEAARGIEESVVDATESQLDQPADMGWTTMPLWRATRISAIEGVLHEWDTRARRETRAVIPLRWARVLAEDLAEDGGSYAHRDAVPRNRGTYLLEVTEGIGPVTVEISDAAVMRAGRTDETDATLDLTPDQYVRLVTGRLSVDAEGISVDGDRERALGLTQVFAGIANG